MADGSFLWYRPLASAYVSLYALSFFRLEPNQQLLVLRPWCLSSKFSSVSGGYQFLGSTLRRSRPHAFALEAKPLALSSTGCVSSLWFKSHLSQSAISPGGKWTSNVYIPLSPKLTRN
jgi:hypothetical protein